jgi:phage FluMu protein Com
MLTVRCRDCNKEISSNSGQSKSCGCANMTTVKGDSVTAVDLSRVVMVQSAKEYKSNTLSPQDLAYQEERRRRKVRKLDFEIR